MNNNLNLKERQEVNYYIRGAAMQAIKHKDRTIEHCIEVNYMNIEEYITMELFEKLVKAKYNMIMLDIF